MRQTADESSRGKALRRSSGNLIKETTSYKQMQSKSSSKNSKKRKNHIDLDSKNSDSVYYDSKYMPDIEARKRKKEAKVLKMKSRNNKLRLKRINKKKKEFIDSLQINRSVKSGLSREELKIQRQLYIMENISKKSRNTEKNSAKEVKKRSNLKINQKFDLCGKRSAKDYLKWYFGQKMEEESPVEFISEEEEIQQLTKSDYDELEDCREVFRKVAQKKLRGNADKFPSKGSKLSKVNNDNEDISRNKERLRKGSKNNKMKIIEEENNSQAKNLKNLENSNKEISLESSLVEKELLSKRSFDEEESTSKKSKGSNIAEKSYSSKRVKHEDPVARVNTRKRSTQPSNDESSESSLSDHDSIDREEHARQLTEKSVRKLSLDSNESSSEKRASLGERTSNSEDKSVQKKRICQGVLAFDLTTEFERSDLLIKIN